MVEPSHGAILARLDEVAGKVDGLTTEVAKTREIVETWQAFKVGGKAVTWVAKIIASGLAIWAALKLGAVAFVDLGVASEIHSRRAQLVAALVNPAQRDWPVHPRLCAD